MISSVNKPVTTEEFWLFIAQQCRLTDSSPESEFLEIDCPNPQIAKEIYRNSWRGGFPCDDVTTPARNNSAIRLTIQGEKYRTLSVEHCKKFLEKRWMATQKIMREPSPALVLPDSIIDFGACLEWPTADLMGAIATSDKGWVAIDWQNDSRRLGVSAGWVETVNQYEAEMIDFLWYSGVDRSNASRWVDGHLESFKADLEVDGRLKERSYLATMCDGSTYEWCVDALKTRLGTVEARVSQLTGLRKHNLSQI